MTHLVAVAIIPHALASAQAFRIWRMHIIMQIIAVGVTNSDQQKARFKAFVVPFGQL